MKTPEQVRAWINDIARKAVEDRKRQIAATTPEQARAILIGIIQDAPDPENWTASQQDTYAEIGFVADWIAAQQSKEAK